MKILSAKNSIQILNENRPYAIMLVTVFNCSTTVNQKSKEKLQMCAVTSLYRWCPGHSRGSPTPKAGSEYRCQCKGDCKWARKWEPNERGNGTKMSNVPVYSCLQGLGLACANTTAHHSDRMLQHIETFYHKCNTHPIQRVCMCVFEAETRGQFQQMSSLLHLSHLLLLILCVFPLYTWPCCQFWSNFMISLVLKMPLMPMCSNSQSLMEYHLLLRHVCL